MSQWTIETLKELMEQRFIDQDKAVQAALQAAKEAVAKAEVATWLAWQKQPGHGLYCAVKDNLLNTDHTLFQELEQWLKKIFPNSSN